MALSESETSGQNRARQVLVTGDAGFIGSHMVDRLLWPVIAHGSSICTARIGVKLLGDGLAAVWR
jgi:hypothetical protein